MNSIRTRMARLTVITALGAAAFGAGPALASGGTWSGSAAPENTVTSIVNGTSPDRVRTSSDGAAAPDIFIVVSDGGEAPDIFIVVSDDGAGPDRARSDALILSDDPSPEAWA